jgi:hypothetical protein
VSKYTKTIDECIKELTDYASHTDCCELESLLTCSCAYLKDYKSIIDTSEVKKTYEPMCPYGYIDCICDCNYIKHYYPDWYKELGSPTVCEDCIAGSNYDDEDK